MKTEYMGTRHITEVKLGGELKVSQYGQWDGYPEGQGLTIAKFLRGVDLEKFKRQVQALGIYTAKDIEQAYLDAGAEKGARWVNMDVSDKVKERHPALSRDYGAGVLQLIHDGVMTRVVLEKEFKNDSLMCEYVYTIDLDNETVQIGSKKYPFKEWTSELMEKLTRDEARN